MTEEYDKEDDELIEMHLSCSPNHHEITLKVVAETPISQDQYEIILLDFIDSLRKGQSSDNQEWLLDENMDIH